MNSFPAVFDLKRTISSSDSSEGYFTLRDFLSDKPVARSLYYGVLVRVPNNLSNSLLCASCRY